MRLEFELPMISMIFILLLNIVYFSRKKVNLLENKAYSIILICSLFESMIDTIVHYICSINSFNVLRTNYYSFFNNINKVLSTLFVIIFMSFLSYILIITYEKIRKNIKKLLIADLSILFCFMFIMLFTNIELVQKFSVINVVGSTATMGYVFVAIFLILSLIISLLNIKKLDKRYITIFIILPLMGVLFLSTLLFPEMILYDVVLALLCYVMYFTIENPDLKIIEELKKNRSLTSKSYIEKTNFLFRMSAEVRKPIENIKELNDYNIESNNIKEIKENSKEIDLNIRNANFTINNVLDVSSLDTKNINIVKNKYNIKKLLNEIYLREKRKINNTRFDFNIGELPEYLYGDSIRLKQVLICILDNLIENTKEGFIEVNVNSINKYDVCRLIITIENSGIPLSLEEINNILDNEKEIDENISLEDINKLINMMNGSLNIKSEEGNEFTISIDSIIVEPKKEEITNETDILFISNNERILKGLEYAFEEYTTNSVMSGIDAIDLIKSGENYNLIIIDDEMKPISGLETLKRLRKENINIPAIIMLDEGKEHIKNHYIKDGFIDYILKSDIKNEINRIIKKML